MPKKARISLYLIALFVLTVVLSLIAMPITQRYISQANLYWNSVADVRDQVRFYDVLVVAHESDLQQAVAKERQANQQCDEAAIQHSNSWNDLLPNLTGKKALSLDMAATKLTQLEALAKAQVTACENWSKITHEVSRLRYARSQDDKMAGEKVWNIKSDAVRLGIITHLQGLADVKRNLPAVEAKAVAQCQTKTDWNDWSQFILLGGLAALIASLFAHSIVTNSQKRPAEEKK